MTGNASVTTGVATADGALKVFAGPREDPLLLQPGGLPERELGGGGGAEGGGPDPDGDLHQGARQRPPGLPILTTAARTTVVGYLGHDCSGTGAPVDFFKKPTGTENASCVKPALVTTPAMNTGLTGNILAIALSVDKALLTTGGPVLNVWGATTK